MFQEMIEPGSAPPLPEGFEEAHDIKKTDGDDSRFKTKDEYLKLWDEQRPATKALLERISDADLDDNRGGKLPPWAPTVGGRAQHGRDARAESFRPVRGRPAEAQEADRVLSVEVASRDASSPLGRKLAPLRRIAALRRQEPIQQGGIDDAPGTGPCR